jgi:hypothetical protein
MLRLCFRNTLGVAYALLCASTLLVVPHGYACSWRAELTNYSTKDSAHFQMDQAPVPLPVLHVEKGVEVQCRIEPSSFLSIGIFQRTKADVLCYYPEGHILTARAIHIFDNAKGEQILYPVMLFFSNTRRPQETLYRLYVDCQ